MASKKIAGASSRRKTRARPGEQSLSVAIVGAGRLGTALAVALASKGYVIEAVVARRKSHARRAARLAGTHTRSLSYAELDRLPACDLLFITTPDDVISTAAAQIASKLSTNNRGRVALHASGALSSIELSSLREVGWSTGSMHPLVAVTDARAGALSLQSAFFCIEGEAQAVRAARKVVRSLGARSFSIKSSDKALYHAAAVMASGHMIALFDVAAEMLVRCGLTEDESRAVLMPLVRSTLENLTEHEPARALTGTFARADIATVRKHLRALGHRDLREALAAYVLLGQRSLRLAAKNGADSATLKSIALALSEARRKSKAL